MPVEKYSRGTGLTKETRVRIKASNPTTSEEIQAIKGLIDRAAVASTFDGTVAAVEAWANDTLEAAGLPANGQAVVDDVQSPLWYANEIQCDLYTIRKIKERIAAGDTSEVDHLAAACVRLGELIYEVVFKLDWEDETIFGIDSRQDRKKGRAAAQQVTDQRDEFLRRLADEYRQKRRNIGDAEIARHILKRAKRAADNSADVNREIWDRVSRLSENRLRRIIPKKLANG